MGYASAFHCLNRIAKSWWHEICRNCPDESDVVTLAFSLLAGPGAITSVKLFSDSWIGRNNAINCKSDSCYIWHILFDGTHLQSVWQARFINYHQGVCVVVAAIAVQYVTDGMKTIWAQQLIVIVLFG